MSIEGQMEIWDILSKEVPQADVKIEGALNVHSKGSIKPFEVTICTGDLVLIVSMIEDYIRSLDELRGSDLNWQCYYRKRYKEMSERIQKQIDYDYEKALKKCIKNREKQSNDDIGEEAMALAVKRGIKQVAKGGEQNADENSNDDKHSDTDGA